MFEVKVKLDLTGQMQKSAILRQVPKAFMRNATRWASETERFIRQSYKGGNVFKRPPKEIDQRLRSKVAPSGDGALITIGTGAYVGKAPVVYARIQEEGGKIVPKNKKFLTVPFPGVTGRAANFSDTFFLKTKRGNLLIAQKTGRGKFRPLFALKQSVTLPARHWFSRPIGERRPELDRIMSAESTWATARAMAEKSGAGG